MRALRDAILLLVATSSVLHAQHAGHDMQGMTKDSTARGALHVMAQAIPLVTRAQPTAEGQTLVEGVLSQPILMARGTYGTHLALDATFNFEGQTLLRGELNTGALGEGYVDRRHPHTYLHELVGSVLGGQGPVGYSLSAGRGFAAFGTDDPMMRPLVKYPLNHHLAQILERGLVTGAVRSGPFIAEASLFNGDEPLGPTSLPRWSRFGDSWSARGTWLPLGGTEIQASYARVKSPEEPSGFGLDQRKQSVSARTVTRNRLNYFLVEWARTRDHDRSRAMDVFSYQSVLAEGSVAVWRGRVGLRLEQTERPEEERLADPFRTPTPAADLSINGITRWRVATLNLVSPGVTAYGLSGFPFVEVARLGAAATDARSLFTPERLYGTTRFWMFTAGVRLLFGQVHDRMGRYGVAIP